MDLKKQIKNILLAVILTITVIVFVIISLIIEVNIEKNNSIFAFIFGCGILFTIIYLIIRAEDKHKKELDNDTIKHVQKLLKGHEDYYKENNQHIANFIHSFYYELEQDLKEKKLNK